LDAGRLIALLPKACLVDHADRVGVGVLRRHDLLHALTHHLLAPTVDRHELLEGAGRNPGLQGDRRHVLALQVADLAPDVGPHVTPARNGLNAVVETTYEDVKLSPQRLEPLHFHRFSLREFQSIGTFSRIVSRGNRRKLEQFLAL
jgi:hypothetical protein